MLYKCHVCFILLSLLTQLGTEQVQACTR